MITLLLITGRLDARFMVLRPAPGMSNSIVSVPALLLAAVIASRKVQPPGAEEHEPSSVSALELTVNVIGAARAAGSIQCRKRRGVANQPVNTRSKIAPRTKLLDRFVLVFIAVSSLCLLV